MKFREIRDENFSEFHERHFRIPSAICYHSAVKNKFI